MAKHTSESWIYAGRLLGVLSETLPPVLTATANVVQGIGAATAEHESRMRDLEEHELRMRLLINQHLAAGSAASETPIHN